MLQTTSNAIRQQVMNHEGNLANIDLSLCGPYYLCNNCTKGRLLKLTSSSNLVARRLEKEVKQVLDEISYDQTAKEQLIRGRQVDLAEELSK